MKKHFKVAILLSVTTLLLTPTSIFANSVTEPSQIEAPISRATTPAAAIHGIIRYDK